MDICSQGKPHIITWVIKKEFYPAHRKRECKKSVLGHQCNWSLAIKNGHLFPSSWNTAEIWLCKKKTGKKVCICVFNALFLPVATKENFAMSIQSFLSFIFFLYHQVLLSACFITRRAAMKRAGELHLILISSRPCLHGRVVAELVPKVLVRENHYPHHHNRTEKGERS